MLPTLVSARLSMLCSETLSAVRGSLSLLWGLTLTPSIKLFVLPELLRHLILDMPQQLGSAHPGVDFLSLPSPQLPFLKPTTWPSFRPAGLHLRVVPSPRPQHLLAGPACCFLTAS